jgi:CRP-like cAMP-binding protein
MAYNDGVSDFTQTPLEPLLATATVRRYPKGQIVLYQGENPADAFIVKSGVIKMYDIDDDGNEKILHLIKPPAIFPAVYFFGATGQTNTFFTTVSDTELYVLSRNMLEKAVEEDPKLATFCMRWFAQEVTEIMRRMSSLEKSSTHAKLLATLGYLVRQHATRQKSGWYRVNFPISHQMLADMVGVTRESTTMVMKELQAEKIVRTPRMSILDINPGALQQM